MKKIIFLLALALIPLKAGALELLLEENRGESGTIGYVDIDRVFKEYSGTTGAREEFITEIKNKEDFINKKKTAVFTLKAEIAKLRQEREFALTLPSLMETKKSVEDAQEQAAAAQVSTQAAAPAALQTTTASTQTAHSPARVTVSTQAAQPLPQTVAASTQTVHSPAQVTVSTQAAQALPQTVAASAQTAHSPAQVTVSTQAAQALLPPGLPGLEGIDMPGVAKVPVTHFKFSVSTSVPEIDLALAQKEAELKTSEEEMRGFQLQTERELLEYESHKSEILLGRIYVALKELAVKEEVSVVMDKRNILYGQNAVDLTEKLLKKLEEGGI